VEPLPPALRGSEVGKVNAAGAEAAPRRQAQVCEHALHHHFIPRRSGHAQAPQRQPQIPGDPPLTELLADYTERHAHTLRSPETARYHALRIGRWCDGRRASEARAVASAIAQDMAGHYAPATINRSLGALKKALRMAWERGRVPVDYSGMIQRQAENNARTTWLTLAQVQQLASHASPAVQAASRVSRLGSPMPTIA
jgi:hypothetical protein